MAPIKKTLDFNPFAGAGGEYSADEDEIKSDDQEGPIGFVDDNGVADHVDPCVEDVAWAKEDGGPRDGVVDGEVEAAAAVGEEEAAAVAAADAPLMPVVSLLLSVRIDGGEVLEEENAIRGGRGQIGV
jgi:hypothetical protein